MPNWCSANYTFYAETDEGKANLRRLHRKISRVCYGRRYADFISLMKMCRVRKSAIDKIRVDCRDVIEHVDGCIYYADGRWVFTMQAETAWSNYYANRAFYYLVTRIFKGVKVAYIADECGNEYYAKHDPIGCYPDKYIFGCIGRDAPTCGTGYFENKKGLVQCMKEYGVDGLDENSSIDDLREQIVSELVDQAQERGVEAPDIRVNIYEYMEIPLEKCDVAELEGV